MVEEFPPQKRLRAEAEAGAEAEPETDPKSTMEEVDTAPKAGDLAKRWSTWQMILSRPTKFGMETGALKFVDGVDFEPDETLHAEVCEACILCVGAGGLGCEILKDLALSGFKNIHVIDLDTIDVTNLNRQFLFRQKDVGAPKAEVAAAFVNRRVPGVTVTPHFGKLQDFPPEWYRQFNVVVAGLDNLEARRWLNQTLCSLVRFEEDGTVDPTSVIPFIDGGTEGLKGQSRVILPMKTSCFECTMSLFPPARGKAVCTLENNPRVPADCATYVYMKVDDNDTQSTGTFSVNEQVHLLDDGIGGLVLSVENVPEGAAAAATFHVRLPEGIERRGVPASNMIGLRQHWVSKFGEDKVDKDSRLHMTFIHERAAERALLFGIRGLTYDKTLGAVKNIIPAVASTNAIIAASTVNEAMKCLSFSGQLCNTYMLYNGQSMAGGVDCNNLVFERVEGCVACAPPQVKAVTIKPTMTVREFVEYVKAQELTTPRAVEPIVYDSEGDAFYVVTGPLATMKASNLDEPMTDHVDDKETVMFMDSTWGKDVKRHVQVSYAA